MWFSDTERTNYPDVGSPAEWHISFFAHTRRSAFTALRSEGPAEAVEAPGSNPGESMAGY